MKPRSVAMSALWMVACVAPALHAGTAGTAGNTAALDHVAITVSNAPASARFYESVFGFPEMKNPFPGGGGVIWLNLGNGLAMHIFGGRKTPIANQHERHFAFGVTDMSHVTGYLKSHGMHWQDFDGVVDQVQTRPDGVHQLFFRDPDGYWIEVNDARGVLRHAP